MRTASLPSDLPFSLCPTTLHCFISRLSSHSRHQTLAFWMHLELRTAWLSLGCCSLHCSSQRRRCSSS
ncbi:unnamed protein product [Chondrus crispus]|uniref:Uncharacterized protein n=1 Tax=Chondrus crispus TaxID=2769 RepID=R7QT03_CHOCR|nr:unnamed protein product [Chondrus crispus]CDF40646.1 unnamed protein product [Chondrus crispus]|eukprot:XP_005710940.1 unnamed protein product [Chondrus crispus]